VNYIAAYSHYIRHRIRANKKFVYIDKEAIFTTTNTKKLIVLVVGETSRAKNFSLNGYERETNPLLSKQKDLVNFTDVMSGGTYTGFSVPKMFSHRSKSDFKLSNSDHEENLLDLMKQVGYDVYWKENDSSCKGVCARVRNINYNGKADKDLCDGDYCFDEILLKDFENDIKNIKQDTIIVLHTIGSHGPTYYRRYPKEFKKFTPTCDTAELQSCPTENIVNVYDNTILYVDFVLNKTIEILKKYPQYKSVMLYASDHGESLGENGFYLHGSPYLIAPLVQKHIPMVLWINNKIKKDIDINCIKQKENNKFSHDNIFHTIIGISNIKTKLYNKNLDIIDGCAIKK
jgi:lipid A ethanolaminephosphotransferase